MKYFLCNKCNNFPNIIDIYSLEKPLIYYKCKCEENTISIMNYFRYFYREINNKNLQKIDKCKSHNENLEFYCKVCNEFFCHACNYEQIHSFHNTIDLRKLNFDFEELKKDIENKKKFIDDFVFKYKENIINELNILIQKIETNYKNFIEENNNLLKLINVFLNSNSYEVFPKIENFTKKICKKLLKVNDMKNFNNHKYTLNERIERVFSYYKNDYIIKLKNFKIEDMKIKYEKQINSTINCLIILNDNRIALSKTENNKNIYIYELQKKNKLKEEMILENHNRKITLLFELKDKRIISCDSKEMKIWTITKFSNKCDLTINSQSNDINQIIQLRNGKILSCSKQCNIIQRNCKTFSIENILIGTKPFYSIIEINDNYLVSSSENLCVWDLNNGKVIKEFKSIDKIDKNKIAYYKNKIYCIDFKKLICIDCKNFQIETCYHLNLPIDGIFISKIFGMLLLNGCLTYQLCIDDLKIISEHHFYNYILSFDLKSNYKICFINEIKHKLFFCLSDDDENNDKINLLK